MNVDGEFVFVVCIIGIFCCLFCCVRYVLWENVFFYVNVSEVFVVGFCFCKCCQLEKVNV